MKKTTIPLAVLIFAGFALSQCTTYTQLADGNYTPDANGAIKFCDFADYNQALTDYNKIVLDLNSIQDQNFQLEVQKGLENFKKDMNRQLQEATQRLEAKTSSLDGNITQKLEETQTQLDAKLEAQNQKIKDNQDATVQKVTDAIAPAVTNASDAKTTAERLISLREQDQNNFNNKIDQSQTDTRLFFIAGMIGLAIAIFLFLKFGKKPKEPVEDFDRPEDYPRIIEKKTSYPAQKQQKDPRKLDDIEVEDTFSQDEPEIARIPSINDKTGKYMERLLNDLHDQEGRQDKKILPVKIKKEKPTTKPPIKEEKLPETKEEVQADIDNLLKQEGDAVQ